MCKSLTRVLYVILAWNARVKCAQSINKKGVKMYVIVVFLIQAWLQIHLESKEQITVLPIFNIVIQKR